MLKASLSLLAVYILVGVFNLEPALAGLPASEEPAREWLGSEYAEAIAASYPGQLYIDLEQLAGFKKEDRFLDIQRKWLKRIFKAALRLDVDAVGQSMRAHISAPVADLLTTLQDGYAVELTDSSAPKKERALADWVLTHEEKSLAPHEIMAHALELTGGELLSAWSITWNVFSSDWRSTATRNYGALTSRLISVTGERHLWQSGARFITKPGATVNPFANELVGDDSKDELEAIHSRAVTQMAITKRGDDFSYFYHRLGVELFSMVSSQMTGSSLLGNAIGKVGAYGEYRTFRFTAGLKTERMKRLNNDLAAASSGAMLYKFAVSGKKPKSKFASFDHYMRTNRLKYGQAYQLPPGVPSHYFGSTGTEAYWSAPMSVEELTRVFDYALVVDSTILNSVLLDGTGDLERLQVGLNRYAESGAQSATLNQYLRTFVEKRKGARLREPGTTLPELSYIDTDFQPESNVVFTQGLRDVADYEEIDRRIERTIDRALARGKSVRFANGRLSCPSLLKSALKN